MLTYDEQRAKIAIVVETFPPTFSLRHAPDRRFRISRSSSYVDDRGTVMLYTEIFDPTSNQWRAYAKGTAAELARAGAPIV